MCRGFYNRRGQPVPGQVIDVTAALQAMVQEQGGRSLEIPRNGTIALPGFGDPAPDLPKRLVIRCIRSGGGTRVTTHTYKENKKVLIMTRGLATCRCVKFTCCVSCPVLLVLTGLFFALRWMMMNLHEGCVDADFSGTIIACQNCAIH